MSLKIGILTLHYSTNPGAVLQAYSLTSILAKLGYDVEIIDYRSNDSQSIYLEKCYPLKKHFPYYRNGWYKNLTSLHKNLSLLRLVGLSKTVKNLEDVQSLSNKYDCIISGSDQIWYVGNARHFDPVLFLGFVTSAKKISFSASVGSNLNFGKYKKEIKNYLEQYSYITVRDKNTANILSEVGLDKAKITLDPTLLFDSFPDVKPIIKEEYILTYFQGEVPEINIGKRTKFVSIGRRLDCTDYHIHTVSALDFVSLLKNATHIITDTFHGAIFSIKNKKKCCLLNSVDKQSKLSFFLEQINFLSALKDRGEPITEHSFEIFEDRDRILNSQIESSLVTLREILNLKN